MNDDNELLRRYAENRDQPAFAELVNRHVGLVHTAALRQLNGDAHLAADATQLVFCDLARKAGRLTGHRVLAGWLFQSTRFATAKLARTENRRRRREQEAQNMSDLHTESDSTLDWDRASPLIDEALSALNATDRDAVLLRFFEGRPFADVGTQLGLGENAARMRVARALEKIRDRLVRRGLTSSTGALAAALAAHGVATAPPAVAAAVVGAGLASGGGTAAGILAFAAGTKLPLGLAAAVVLVAGSAYLYQTSQQAQLETDLSALQAQTVSLPELRAEVAGLSRSAIASAQSAEQARELARITTEIAALRAAQSQMASSAAKTVSADKNFSAVPQPRRMTGPKYPPALREAGIEGTVMVDIIVDSTGVVARAAAAEGKTHLTEKGAPLDASDPRIVEYQAALQEAATAAVSSWEFNPGIHGQRTVNTRMSVPIVFSLGPRPTDNKVDTKEADAVWF